MPSRKQKILTPKGSSRKLSRARKLQPATPTPKPTTKRLLIKLKLSPIAHKDPQAPAFVYQNPFDTPVSDDAPTEAFAEKGKLPIFHAQSRRRGESQTSKTHQPDMVLWSEMNSLPPASVTISKVENGNDEHVFSSPPAAISMQAPTRYDSPATVQGARSPPPRYTGPVSEDVYNILSTLKSSPGIQVELPSMFAPGGTGVTDPYTASLLTELYIQCYENQLWNFCDLVADTWIRALQTANKRSQSSTNVQDHMWRKNLALEKKFAEKKKGFKTDVFEFGLDVKDPEMGSDVTVLDAKRLRDLYAHTTPQCGVRLLWADAMALCGKKMEHEITRRPDVWPQEVFYDVMCASLRMVGRKLTLKIEEKYEGAWCRYHEHAKRGLLCYRKLAWMHKESKGQDEEDGHAAEVQMRMEAIKGEKQALQAMGRDDQCDGKRVHFDASGAGAH